MREFFVNENPKFLFKQFGLIHNIFNIAVLLGIILIYINRNKISKIPRQKSMLFLKISAVILLINMLIYTFGNMYYGCFDYKEMLPLHLCFIANYMFMYGILFEKENILKLTILICFIGPIPAILWPNLVSTIDNFNFWQYVISHHFFLLLSLFSYYALNYKVRRVDYIKTVILLNTMVLAIAPFNKLFNMNYIFTNYIAPNVLEIYPWLKPINPVILIEIVGFVISLIIYNLLIVRRNKELENKK